MEERFLPVGTVVLLKGGKKRVMIIGFCAIAKEQPDKVFDYSGCIYPEGLMASNQTCMFDHEQIEKVFYKGLVDEEETAFKEKLNALINEVGDLKLKPGTEEAVAPAEPAAEETPAPVETVTEEVTTEEVAPAVEPVTEMAPAVEPAAEVEPAQTPVENA